MTGNDLLQLLGSIGGASVLATVVTAFINRRKMGADVTEVIQKAAGGAVELVQADNVRLRAEAGELRTENGKLWSKSREHEQENAVLIDVIRDQQRYISRQSAEIRRLGGTIEDPPELPTGVFGPPRQADVPKID